MEKMNKKGLELKQGLFSIIAVSLAVIATGTIITSWDDKYNSGVSSDLDVFNKLNETSDFAGSSRGRISPNDPDPSEDAEANTYRGVYGILTNIFTSFDTVMGNDGMINEVTNRYGIPDYIRQGIIAMILLGITFALIAIIFRLGRGTA